MFWLKKCVVEHLKMNSELAEKLHKSIIRKSEKQKLHS